MNRPRELDVPHWAIHRVKEVRNSLALPAGVTDRMIYARLVDTSDGGPMQAATKRDQIASLKALAEEVENED